MRRKSKRSLTVKQRKKQVVKARDKNSKKEQVSLNSPEDLKNDCSEVTNTNPNKRKVAPRSSDQFKVGPDFDDTEVHRKCFISSTKEHIVPVISARIDRGFDLINNEWVGYKRNYFTLVSTFEFLDQPGDLCSNTKFHICDDEGKEVNIECFAIRLVSECCENDVGVVLVQHTPKRDRGPQYLPPVFVSVPGVLPEHEVIKSSANIRNGVKMSQLDRLFYLEENKLKQAKEGSILKGYPKGKVCTVAKYERMQFSTTLNYRKPALLNRRFVLRVELLAVLADEKYSVLASSETPPLIVRGRSPSNYKLSLETAREQEPEAEKNEISSQTHTQLPIEEIQYKKETPGLIIDMVNQKWSFFKSSEPVIFEDHREHKSEEANLHDILSERLEDAPTNYVPEEPPAPEDSSGDQDKENMGLLDAYQYYEVYDEQDEFGVGSQLQLHLSGLNSTKQKQSDPYHRSSSSNYDEHRKKSKHRHKHRHSHKHKHKHKHKGSKTKQESQSQGQSHSQMEPNSFHKHTSPEIDYVRLESILPPIWSSEFGVNSFEI